MKALVEKVSLLALSLVLGLALAATPAQAQLGTSAGYDVNIFNDPGFSGSASNSFESTGGFEFGLFYNFPLGERLAVRPGVFVQQSSFEWHLESEERAQMVDLFSPIEGKFRVAKIPIDVRYRFTMDSMTPYVLAGPSFNFVHTDHHDLRMTLDGKQTGNTMFMGANLGVGIEIPVSGLGLSLQPELRYSHALSGFHKEDYVVRAIEFDSDSSLSMSSLSFRLGLSFLSI